MGIGMGMGMMGFGGGGAPMLPGWARNFFGAFGGPVQAPPPPAAAAFGVALPPRAPPAGRGAGGARVARGGGNVNLNGNGNGHGNGNNGGRAQVLGGGVHNRQQQGGTPTAATRRALALVAIEKRAAEALGIWD